MRTRSGNGSRQACIHIFALTTNASVSCFGAVSPEAERGIGRICRRRCIRGNGATLTATTTDRLQQNRMGAITLCDQSSIDKEIHRISIATIAAGTPHRHGSRDIATSSTVVDRACGATATTDGLQKHCMRSITKCLNCYVSRGSSATESDRSSTTSITTVTRESS